MRISSSMQSARLRDLYNSEYFKKMTKSVKEEEKTKESQNASNANKEVVKVETKETGEKKIESSKDENKKKVQPTKEDEQKKVFKEFMKYHNNQGFNKDVDVSDIRLQNMKSMMLRANMASSLLNYM